MQSQRFFIGDLPLNINEYDLRKAFQVHGDVTNIELKEKLIATESSNKKILAFVTITLFDDNVSRCLRKLNEKPIKGEYINVQVAKESFLERLKREREETSKKETHPEVATSCDLKGHVEPAINSKKIFNSEDEAEDNEDVLLITKKKAAHSIKNGKIVIEGVNNAPIHVIGKRKEIKEFNEKSLNADKKRKESMKQKKNQYQHQKSLIQKALAATDTQKSKKIKFNEYDDDETTPTVDKRKTLFEEDTDEDNDSYAKDFSIKSEYEGSRGAALMELQKKMNLDPRFKIDQKFLDEPQDESLPDEPNEERDWQFDALSKVTGNSTNRPKDRQKKRLTMQRYDPSTDDRQENLPVRSNGELTENQSNSNRIEVDEGPKVSKDVFYVVSDNLSKSLKTRGEGFSLLSMFGDASTQNDKPAEINGQERVLCSKNNKSVMNPFTYDSSDTENENEEHSTIEENKRKVPKKFLGETFFIPKNDARLKEGMTFFRHVERPENGQDYDEIKEKLRNVIKTKIKKSNRNLKSIGKSKRR